MSNRPRSTGTVRWFNAYKGFGFIAPDDGGDDLFVHHASILYHGYRTLSEYQLVAFLLDYAQDGRTKAVDVTSLLRSRPSHATGRGSYSGRGRVGGYGERYAGGILTMILTGMVGEAALGGELEATAVVVGTARAPSATIVAPWVIWQETVIRVLGVALADAVVVVEAAEAEEEAKAGRAFIVGRKGILRGNVPISINENVGYFPLLYCGHIYN